MSAIITEPEIQIQPETLTLVANNQAGVSLASQVKEAALKYLCSLGGKEPAEVYKLFLSQVEKPLLEVMLEYNNNRNQSATAKQLGISRGTLRSKMEEYGLLKINS